MTEIEQIRAALARPFDPSTVKWRLGTTFKRSNEWRGTALAYIDARHVMDRLDQVVGPDRWQSTIDEKPSGRVLCSLGIKFVDEWIFKTDGAGNTDIEGDKGGISDALKRAAVQHGIGRYLYGMGVTIVRVEGGQENNNKLRGGRIPSGEFKRLEQAIRLQFAGQENEARQLLETVDTDEGASSTPAPAPAPGPAPQAAAGTSSPEDVGAKCHNLLNDWDARIRDAGMIEDLRDIHAEMNTHREVFKISADFVTSFKQIGEALRTRKTVLEQHESSNAQAG